MSKYKYVYKYVDKRYGKTTDAFRSTIKINGVIWYSKIIDCERLCAIEADKYLISIGKEPVNILIKKL